MSEADAASPANLDDERDELKFELIVLKGHLKDKFDFSSMIDPLLDATAPATIEINAKMKKLVARLQAQLETLNIPDRNKPTTPSPAPPPPARAGRAALAPAVPPPPTRYRAPSQTRQRAKRPRIADPPQRAENGEILPRVGDFAVFAPMLPKTIHETGAAARWAINLLRAGLEEAMKARNLARWLLDNWEKGPDGERPPCVSDKFRSHITGCYLVPSNLLHAATADNKDVIEIARGRCARVPTEHGHVYQENFKKWAIQHGAAAAVPTELPGGPNHGDPVDASTAAGQAAAEAAAASPQAAAGGGDSGGTPSGGGGAPMALLTAASGPLPPLSAAAVSASAVASDPAVAAASGAAHSIVNLVSEFSRFATVRREKAPTLC